MPHDRFVYVQKLDHATVERVLVAYVGGAAAVEWNDDQGRWYVTFPSAYSDAFQQTDPEDPQERWIEVYDGLDDAEGAYINVMTRHADCFVTDVANGIAQRLSNRWGVRGKRECHTCGAARNE